MWDQLKETAGHEDLGCHTREVVFSPENQRSS